LERICFPYPDERFFDLMSIAGKNTLKKVAIIGPECTGKSVLAAFLADHFKTEWVREYAREFIEGLGRPYNENDLLTIARGQLRIEDEAARHAAKVLFCDTDLYVIKVWSVFKYGRTNPEILKLMEHRQYDLYLLAKIDIPWMEDPQREHPHKREELYAMYLDEMKNQPVPFVEIGGEQTERRQTAIAAVNNILSNE
jgi:NadR type nicotinamide-nucleotide adenylyltransferase